MQTALNRQEVPHRASRLARTAEEPGGGGGAVSGSAGAPLLSRGPQAGAAMTRGMTRAMRRAADVAGAGARPPKRQGDDPKAGARHTQPSSRARAQVRGHTGDPLASTVSPDLTPDVYVLRVKLEETGELFRVANCRNDMTVRELKEELDLMVGIPFNLQRLHFLDRGGPCPTPSRTP